MDTVGVIIGALTTILEMSPQIVSTIEGLNDLGQRVFEAVYVRAPTQEEQDALQARIDADVAHALMPLPDEN